MTYTPYIVAVGGTLRNGSSTEKALRFALNHAESLGARTLMIAGEDLNLPLYGTESSSRTPAAAALVVELAKADGVLLGSPGYHGSISGVMKNAIDYIEDLRGDVRPYLSDRSVACVGVAGGWAGAVSTLGALRDVVHALRGWPTPMGVAINSSSPVFDADGQCLDPRVAQTLSIATGEVVRFARMIGQKPG